MHYAERKSAALAYTKVQAPRRSLFPSGIEEDVALFHCLVVDDTDAVRQLVGNLLEELGFQVDTARDGAEALQKFGVRRYDLVVSDLEMPKLNGYFLAARIKSISPGTKTIIMTGRSRSEVSNLMIMPMVDAWLFKPFKLHELLGVLDYLEFSGISLKTAT